MKVDVLAVLLLGLLRTRGRESRTGTSVRIEHDHLVEFFLHGAGGPGKVSRGR